MAPDPAEATALEKLGRLCDALEQCGHSGHCLDVCLARILFCLFADNTGIFQDRAFLHCVEGSKNDGSDLAGRVSNLFETLGAPDGTVAKNALLSPNIQAFQSIIAILLMVVHIHNA